MFRALSALLPRPQWPPADEDGAPESPKQPLSLLQNSAYAPDTKRVLLIRPSFIILLWEFIDLVK